MMTMKVCMETLICVSNRKRVLVANVFDEGKIEQQILKLHVQMAHPIMERFIKRLKTGRAWEDKMLSMIEKIYHNCESKSCRARKETQYVRKVAFRHAEKLGDLVAMDLIIILRHLFFQFLGGGTLLSLDPGPKGVSNL